MILITSFKCLVICLIVKCVVQERFWERKEQMCKLKLMQTYHFPAETVGFEQVNAGWVVLNKTW